MDGYKKPELSFQDYLNKANEGINALRTSYLPPNSIVIFDIDDTVINSEQKPIVPIIELYKAIQKAGIPIVFVTARPFVEPVVRYTVQQLEFFGITGYIGIYFRNQNMINVPEFKRITRAEIMKVHNKIPVLNIGEQTWDMGEFGYNLLLNN